MYKKIIVMLLQIVSFFELNAQEVKFCRPNNMVSAYLYIAESQRYFEDEGITAKYETVSNVKLCYDLLTSGKVDITNGAEGPLTYFITQNPPFKIIAKIISNPDTGIYARRDSGIKDISDLKGKRIGYLPGTISAFLLFRLMEKYNWQKSDLRLTPLQPAAMPLALTGNIIDAFLMWEPWGTHAVTQLGSNGVFFKTDNLYVSNTQIVANNNLIENNPDLVRKIIKVYKRAEEFLNKTKEEAIKILSEKISYPYEVLKQNWSNYQFKVSFDDTVIKLMQENFHLLKKFDENYTNINEPNWEAIIDRRF